MFKGYIVRWVDTSTGTSVPCEKLFNRVSDAFAFALTLQERIHTGEIKVNVRI